ncbi:FecCD family ABC transporter permease [Gluconacetobacter sacchari]|uniref:FecCD family ABC transporter permease n=1 Tax=Gluconacetobacter sacchari TaxID=92759 RepID=UPI0039B3CC58
MTGQDRAVRLPPSIFLCGLALALCLSLLASLDIGATGVGLRAAWAGSGDGMAWTVLSRIRAPRVAMAALTGAALGVAGTIMQGLFRNPLADPSLIGVSPGSALATALVIVAGGAAGLPGGLGLWSVPFAGMAGGFATTALLYVFATRNGVTSIGTILLAGVAFGAFSGALTGILIFRANDQALRDLTFWTMGSLAGTSWRNVMLVTPFLAFGLLATLGLVRPLNALLLGEEDARLMGYPVERTKRLAMLAVAAMVGATVSIVGAIGFVGVVVPHLVRLATGPDHRLVLPASALLGATLLTLSDSLARVIAAPAEVPVGIVTAVLGAPAFVWLLTRTHDPDMPS